VNILALLIFCLLLPAGVLADTKPMATQTPVAREKAEPSKAPVEKKKPEGLVIGKNLKVGMSLEEAIKLLGIPRAIKTKRGTESTLDSVSIEYANHGIVVHFLSGKGQVEALEILPQFAGSFAEGVKMGEKVTTMIGKYGVPQSMNASLAKYPERGMYFSLKNDVLVAAHVFARNSKLLSHQLYKNP
jgi:hypothetical protein